MNSLWLVDVDGLHGANPRQLTKTGGEYAALWKTSWSPDGERLAFWAGGADGTADVYVIDADGRNERDISAAGMAQDQWWPAWSPDGTRIAFVQTDPAAIVVVDPDGSNPVRFDGPPVRADPMTNCGVVVWSPDGKRLMAVSTGLEGDPSTDVLAVFDLPGTGHRTTIPADNLCSFSWQRLAP